MNCFSESGHAKQDISPLHPQLSSRAAIGEFPGSKIRIPAYTIGFVSVGVAALETGQPVGLLKAAMR
jgi:hypothetical protein